MCVGPSGTQNGPRWRHSQKWGQMDTKTKSISGHRSSWFIIPTHSRHTGDLREPVRIVQDNGKICQLLLPPQFFSTYWLYCCVSMHFITTDVFDFIWLRSLLSFPWLLCDTCDLKTSSQVKVFLCLLLSLWVTSDVWLTCWETNINRNLFFFPSSW